MPEGPEIKQAADKIKAAVTHSPVEEIFFAFQHLKPYESQLKNHRITTVDNLDANLNLAIFAALLLLKILQAEDDIIIVRNVKNNNHYI